MYVLITQAYETLWCAAILNIYRPLCCSVSSDMLVQYVTCSTETGTMPFVLL